MVTDIDLDDVIRALQAFAPVPSQRRRFVQLPFGPFQRERIGNEFTPGKVQWRSDIVARIPPIFSLDFPEQPVNEFPFAGLAVTARSIAHKYTIGRKMYDTAPTPKIIRDQLENIATDAERISYFAHKLKQDLKTIDDGNLREWIAIKLFSGVHSDILPVGVSDLYRTIFGDRVEIPGDSNNQTMFLSQTAERFLNPVIEKATAFGHLVRLKRDTVIAGKPGQTIINQFGDSYNPKLNLVTDCFFLLIHCFGSDVAKKIKSSPGSRFGDLVYAIHAAAGYDSSDNFKRALDKAVRNWTFWFSIGERKRYPLAEEIARINRYELRE